LPLQDFENLTICNDFQELTGIGRIENWKEHFYGRFLRSEVQEAGA